MSAGWVERHLVNRAVRIGVWLGRDIDGVHTLETTGRRTGRPRRTPVKLLEIDTGRYVVSLRGESGWVRNLRQEPRARILLGRGAERVTAIELPPDQRSPVIQAYLVTALREEARTALAQGVAEIPAFRLDRGS
jgi:deazaflavin-dependent oxidoreductase (nitroreductase family)